MCPPPPSRAAAPSGRLGASISRSHARKDSRTSVLAAATCSNTRRRLPPRFGDASFPSSASGSHCAAGLCLGLLPGLYRRGSVAARTTARRQPRIKLMYELQTRDTVWPDGLRLLSLFDRGESLEKIRARASSDESPISDSRGRVLDVAINERRRNSHSFL